MPLPYYIFSDKDYTLWWEGRGSVLKAELKKIFTKFERKELDGKCKVCYT